MRKLKFIFLICIGVIASFDLLSTYGQAIMTMAQRKTFQLHDLSYQFLGLQGIFKDVRTIGYYTDKNIDTGNPLATAQFEQAQYVLAPTVLDLNNTQWRWVIFDCSTPQVAIEAMKRLGFTPMKAYNGIVLGLNPNGS